MADNTDHDEHDLGEEENAQPYKLRMTVPPVDVSVIQWLDAQRNTSQSLRQLIRESIQRDGFVDVYYKPIEQLPRRGRPPGTGTSGDEGDALDESVVTARATQIGPAGSGTATVSQFPEALNAGFPVVIHDTGSDSETSVSAPEPEPVPAAPAAHGQIDMDSMFNQRD